MVTALSPLHKEFTIKKVFVSTYQAVSGAGKAAMDELFNQTKGVYVNDSSCLNSSQKKYHSMSFLI